MLKATAGKRGILPRLRNMARVSVSLRMGQRDELAKEMDVPVMDLDVLKGKALALLIAA